MNRKANFFIVGAPKCGTTSLYKYLEIHPQAFLSNPKEVNFFSGPELEAQGIYYSEFETRSKEDYQQIFAGAKEEHIVIGEASVSYLFYPDVPEKIYDFNKDAKILIMLRDPVKRAFSHYLMDDRMGLVKKGFEEIFEEKLDGNPLHFQQYFLLGNYYTQITSYLKTFQRESVHIIFTEDLKTDQEAVLKGLCEFLEIDDSFEVDDSEYNSFKEAKNPLIKQLYKSSFMRNSVKKLIPGDLLKRIKQSIFKSEPPKLDEEVGRKVKEYYHEEVVQLETLLNRDLTAWK